MKKMFLAITLFGLTSYAQDFKKVPKNFCKIDHVCRLEYKHDDFDNADVFKIGHFETGLSNKKSITYTLDKPIFKGQHRVLWTLFGIAEGCRTKESYVHLKFNNGQDLKLMNISPGVKCGVSYITVDITDFMDLMEKEPIAKLRIRIDSDDDFEVYDKGQQKLFNNLKCIDAATPLESEN